MNQPNNIPLRLIPCVSAKSSEVMIILIENPKLLSWRIFTIDPER